ncbi:hypothetical protein P4200_23055 [Pseudomonas aeruginosa]|nr:hypothetical protein [Pseudomonas aeruginosa]
MTHRIIHFKQQALLDPETYQAMLADGVGHWEALVGKVVGIEDEKSHEFAALKSLFKRSATPMTRWKCASQAITQTGFAAEMGMKVLLTRSPVFTG